jgi:hypothetical protein
MTDGAEYISLYFNTTLPKQICLKIRISNHSLRKCGAINLLVFFYYFEDNAENQDDLYTGRSFHCQNLQFHRQNLYYLYGVQSLNCHDVKDSGVNQYYTGLLKMIVGVLTTCHT